MNHETIYDERTHEHLKGSLVVPDPLVNCVKGVVHSQCVGAIRTTVRIRTGRRIELHARLPIDDSRCFFPGQQVIAMIPAEAVRLEAGLFRRSRQRLNRWYGRIVLVKSLDDGQLITAKLHGEGWSLASTLPILGATHPMRTWDAVNIVVDHQGIELLPVQNDLPSQYRLAGEKSVRAHGISVNHP